MKNLVLALMLLVSTLAIAQDGRTRVNYYNQTSQTLRMLIDGRPACTGDVIPQGYCTEPVTPGVHSIGATNGQQSVGRNVVLEDGETFNYTVSEQEAAYTPGLKRVTVAQYSGFSVDSPVALASIETNGSHTANNGTQFTSNIYQGVTQNVTYTAGTMDYTFALTTDDLQRGTDGFVKSVGGTVVLSKDYTVNGQSVRMTSVQTEAHKYLFLITFKGNRAYMFVAEAPVDGLNSDDLNSVNTFFTTITLQ